MARLGVDYLIMLCMRAIKLLATGLLAYATIITAKCPCTKVNGCHKKEFFLSTGAAIAAIAYENGLL